jgi:zinc D-Ala-D-Ala dipeptidase
MKKSVIVFPFLLLVTCFLCITAMAQPNILPASKQLMVVITGGWSNLQGSIYVFDKQDGKWVFKFSNPIVVGGKGLGVGEGLIPLSIENAPVKKEGDMKSPAGFFSIGTAFGYADHKDAGLINNPYKKATDTLICVDDPHSIYYNTLINSDTAKTDYKSFEHMRLQKDYYKWGLFINHNSPGAMPGSGSCVFMHIWGNDHEGTSGCTAMAEENMLRILHCIKASDNSQLVQLPRNEYLKIKGRFNLPDTGNL